MTDGNIELTRRKILASLGAVGAAGAGAGLGTSALFTDEESFTNNSLVAGTLDMKVDWEEHYSFPQLYGLGDPASGLDVTRSEPSDPSNYTAFPPGVEADSDGEPILWVHNEDVQAFHNNTSIEAYPDTSSNGTADDGVQDDFDPANACSVLTDVSDGSGGLDDSARTENAATSLGDPLINLGDVKPGDFGEVTLSFHLCNNPGYVWMNGALRSSSEGGLTEPEGDSPDEQNGTVELLDEVQTALWYDENCDNLTDGATGGGGGGKVDVVFVIDASGSMEGVDGTDERSALQNQIPTLASDLQTQGDVQFAIVDYLTGAGLNDAGTRVDNLDMTGDVTDLQSALNDGPVPSAPGSDSGSFGESLSNAILYAAGQKVSGEGINFRSGSKRIYVGITDEPDQSTNQEKVDAVAELNGTSSAFLGIAQSQSQVQYLYDNTNESQFAQFDANDISSFETALESLVQFTGTVSGAEEIFFQGSLRDALNALSSGDGIPLDGDGGNDFDETSDPENADSRGCFEPTPNTNCIGFSWWIPTEVGNQIQSDSVAFDLGFYTEQCRNNDGAGNFANDGNTASGGT